MKTSKHMTLIRIILLIGILLFIIGFFYPIILLVHIIYCIGRLLVQRFIEKDKPDLFIIVVLILTGPFSGIGELIDIWFGGKK